MGFEVCFVVGMVLFVVAPVVVVLVLVLVLVLVSMVGELCCLGNKYGGYL